MKFKIYVQVKSRYTEEATDILTTTKLTVTAAVKPGFHFPAMYRWCCRAAEPVGVDSYKIRCTMHCIVAIVRLPTTSQDSSAWLNSCSTIAGVPPLADQ